MDRPTSSLPDFLASPLASIRLSLSSSPSSASSTSPTPPPPPFTAAAPTLLTADLPAFIAARQLHSRALTHHKVHRALHTLHSDSLAQLLGNERQQQRAVASMVARSGVLGAVEAGLGECEFEAKEMDELLGELIVRLKALDGVVARLPPLASHASLNGSDPLQG